MEIAGFLAQFWGWLLVILGIAFLVRRQALMDTLYRLVGETGSAMLTGYLALVLGLATVLLHNVWTVDWQGLVTVFGWISLVKGIARIGWPELPRKTFTFLKDNTMLMQALLAVSVLLGAYLIYQGGGY